MSACLRRKNSRKWHSSRRAYQSSLSYHPTETDSLCATSSVSRNPQDLNCRRRLKSDSSFASNDGAPISIVCKKNSRIAYLVSLTD